jgi:hypothetical protein
LPFLNFFHGQSTLCDVRGVSYPPPRFSRPENLEKTTEFVDSNRLSWNQRFSFDGRTPRDPDSFNRVWRQVVELLDRAVAARDEARSFPANKR